MRKSYDFRKAAANPYSNSIKQQITIRLDPDSIRYFKEMARESGISYQNLIDLYLKDCAREKRRLSLKWLKSS